jgi:crotonobetainyl-CoA:carnitine CoA-transferase CaiB-like acyl-CoA transferase
VRVESITRPDLGRVNRATSASAATNPDDKPWFNHLNTSKYSLALDLKHPRSRDVVERLIRWADVVNENFTPGTMAKLGYDYGHVMGIKSDIIMIGSSVYGQTGPMARQWGVDGTGAALSGHLDLTGWPDRGPVGPHVAYGDIIVPLFGALAIVAALDYKRRTGKGQYIDISMSEICVHQVTPALLDYQANGHLQTRNGNRAAYACPHGVFPCLGEDRWCAIAVFSDEEWRSLCHVMGDPPWSQEPRFATLHSRKKHEDALEALVAAWTQQHIASDVMRLMQEAAVPAGVVQSMEDIADRDPQLKHRGFLVPLDHPVLGTFGHIAPPFNLSRTKARVRTSPCLGEHTDFVCTQLLGMSDEEFVELTQEGVFV